MNELIGEETAKAIQEAAKAGSKVIDLLNKISTAVGETLGDVPKDSVALLLGDWLHQKRIRNMAILSKRTIEILDKRGVSPSATADVSPTLLVPLVRAAADDSRPELQELWARLLADAMDPKRGKVRLSFIEAVRRFDSLDALVMQQFFETPGPLQPNPRDYYAIALNIRPDEIEVSFINLHKLGCLTSPDPNPSLTALGRELMRAIRD